MDGEAKTVDEEAPERKALEHAQWLEAAIRERGRIDRKRLYRMRPKGMDVLGFEAAVRKLKEEGKITGTNILIWKVK
jgi:glucose-6-phosphate-specific signal transduction histidine kinase